MNPDSGTPSPWLLPLIVGFWLIVFPLFWVGITGLLSILGGWRELAAQYAVDPAAWKGTPTRNTSGALHRGFLPVNYSNTLRVHVRDEGFGLAVWRLFGFMHPPLFIPWTAVRDCEERSMLFWRYVQITLHTSSVRILVGGGPGRAIMEGWMASRATPDRTPAMSR